MIIVTRLNGQKQFAVNPDLIERIESNPDTTLVLVGGTKYIVAEKMPEVINLITLYRAQVVATAGRIDTAGEAFLHAVPDPERE